MVLPIFIESIIDGFVGGLIYIIVQNIGWGDKQEIIRRLLAGIVAGYVASLLKIVDPITIVFIGYFAIDFFEAIIENRIRKKESIVTRSETDIKKAN